MLSRIAQSSLSTSSYIPGQARLDTKGAMSPEIPSTLPPQSSVSLAFTSSSSPPTYRLPDDRQNLRETQRMTLFTVRAGSETSLPSYRSRDDRWSLTTRLAKAQVVTWDVHTHTLLRVSIGGWINTTIYQYASNQYIPGDSLTCRLVSVIVI